MCAYVCIGFIDFMLKVISVVDYTNLLKVTKRLKSRNYIALFVTSIENLKILKYHTYSKNISCFYFLQKVLK